MSKTNALWQDKYDRICKKYNAGPSRIYPLDIRNVRTAQSGPNDPARVPGTANGLRWTIWGTGSKNFGKSFLKPTLLLGSLAGLSGGAD